jgi:IS5 family transposase
MLEQLKQLPKQLGRVKTPTADAGYASQNNVNASEQAKIRPLIALGRQARNPSRDERFAEPAWNLKRINALRA